MMTQSRVREMRATLHPLRTALFSSLVDERNQHTDDAASTGLDLVARLLGLVRDAARVIVTGNDPGPRYRPLDDAPGQLLFVTENLTRLEWLYDRLADESSRHLLIELLRRRILGRAREPRSTSNVVARSMYTQARVACDLLRQHDATKPSLQHLKCYQVPASNGSIKLHAQEQDVLHTFLLEQYGYARGGTTVHARPGDVVIDGGSCHGDATLYFADQVGAPGHVYSIELDAGNVVTIEENLMVNPRLRDRVTVIQRALGERSGDRISYRPDRRSTVPVRVDRWGPLSVDPWDPLRVDSWGTVLADASTTSIDDLVEQESISRVDFIKLHVDGYTRGALMGACKTILTHRPVLAVSVHHAFDDILTIPLYVHTVTEEYDFFLDQVGIHGEQAILFAKPRSRTHQS